MTSAQERNHLLAFIFPFLRFVIAIEQLSLEIQQIILTTHTNDTVFAEEHECFWQVAQSVLAIDIYIGIYNFDRPTHFTLSLELAFIVDIPDIFFLMVYAVLYIF